MLSLSYPLPHEQGETLLSSLPVLKPSLLAQESLQQRMIFSLFYPGTKAVAELSVCPLMSVLSGQQVFTDLCKETKMMLVWPDLRPIYFFVHIFMKFVNSSGLCFFSA